MFERMINAAIAIVTGRGYHSDSSAAAILQYVNQNPGDGTDKIEEYMETFYDVSPSATRSMLRDLENAGLLVSSESSYGRVRNWDEADRISPEETAEERDWSGIEDGQD